MQCERRSRRHWGHTSEGGVPCIGRENRHEQPRGDGGIENLEGRKGLVSIPVLHGIGRQEMYRVGKENGCVCLRACVRVRVSWGEWTA